MIISEIRRFPTPELDGMLIPPKQWLRKYVKFVRNQDFMMSHLGVISMPCVSGYTLVPLGRNVDLSEWAISCLTGKPLQVKNVEESPSDQPMENANVVTDCKRADGEVEQHWRSPLKTGELQQEPECARLMRGIFIGNRKVQAEEAEATFYLQLLKINEVLEERKTAGEDLLDGKVSQNTRQMRKLEPELIQDVEDAGDAVEFVREEFEKCKLDEADRAVLASKYSRSPMEEVLATCGDKEREELIQKLQELENVVKDFPVSYVQDVAKTHVIRITIVPAEDIPGAEEDPVFQAFLAPSYGFGSSLQESFQDGMRTLFKKCFQQ